MIREKHSKRLLNCTDNADNITKRCDLFHCICSTREVVIKRAVSCVSQGKTRTFKETTLATTTNAPEKENWQQKIRKAMMIFNNVYDLNYTSLNIKQYKTLVHV